MDRRNEESAKVTLFDEFAEDGRAEDVAYRTLADEGAIILMRAGWTIYKFFRRHLDLRIYHYYRDLINFRERGNPALMLKSINPREAALLDGASGARVRFRLGGDCFPPKIYYKIFVHAPCVDLGAFAPRDYTRHFQVPPKLLHNRGETPPGGETMPQDWYHRVDNNGWRLMSDSLLRPGDDHVIMTSASKAKPFHYSRQRRKDDAARDRKAKKLQWLQEMYSEGRRKEVAERTEGERIEPTIEEVEALSMEEETSKLLLWSANLDYEGYYMNWQTLGSTAAASGTPASA
mmetsp:Transcript_26675/g.43619  ORF Transcript_26675/g.43619 Transcript_26675/m.43619 type:complete len:290 (-) Transcript_26675:475-1344(-)